MRYNTRNTQSSVNDKKMTQNISTDKEDGSLHIALSPWDLTDDYNRHAAVTLLSLLEHCSVPVTVHLLFEKSLSKGKEAEEERTILRYKKIADKYNCSIHYHPVTLPEWVNSLSAVHKWTRGTLLRLYLPDILPEINKILYLDCDIVVMADAAKIWNLPLDNYYLGAVKDSDIPTYSSRRIKIYNEKEIPADSYFCAGLILFNLEKIRQNTESFGDLLLEHLKKNPTLPFLDQDLLNWYCKGDYLQLNDRYNIYSWKWDAAGSTEDFILHYAWHEVKPWKLYSGAVDNYYWNYLMQTPWCEKSDDILKYLREAPNLKKVVPLLLWSDFSKLIDGTKRQKMKTAWKLTLHLWRTIIFKK
ncbi:MAG TPA: glycosyltransferase family 8 protein [Methanocorpusculum sp.]|nr:glycosyltransferase family 8 protein [Methanocorpusculum sp.]